MSSLLKHAVCNLPHALLSSLLSNVCLRMSCPGFEAAKFLLYLRSPTPVHRYKTHPAVPVWDTGKLKTLAFWNGMEPTVRFVWTIPTVDISSKYLFSRQVSVIVRGKERVLSVFVHSHDTNVHIAVLYNAGKNKECPAGELNVQIALACFSMHDPMLDATERSLGAGMDLPCSMLLEIPLQTDLNTWRDPVPKCYSTVMGKAADLVKFTRLVVCANIRFVASDAY